MTPRPVAPSRVTTRSRSPIPTTSSCSRATRWRCVPRRTTSCSTAGSSAPARSGSIRPSLQRRVFAAIGIDPDEAERKFGFFLNPFEYGAPPHGGFAFGIDRLVAILAGEENIREVIAFPKTQAGADPMTNSPLAVTKAQLDVLGIRVVPPAAKGS